MYAEFESALAAAVADGRLAGAVALVTDRGGAVYRHAAGRRAAASDAAMTADTVFWIASMTKAIASVAAVQLADRGRLDLDTPLGGLVPELDRLEVFESEGPDGVWTTRPARRAPTLRELLSHTAGFSYGFIDPRIDPWLKRAGVANGTRASYHQPLLFDPGEGWSYGVGIDWAGVAVEAASGQRLDAYIAEHVTGPLGMTDTVFTLGEAHAGRAAGVHARLPDGGLAPIPFAMPRDPELVSGGGGLHSTAEDYGRFVRFLLGDGAPLLSAPAMSELRRVQTGPHRAGAWTSAAPNLSRDIDLSPGMATGWSLAAMVTPEPGPNGRGPGSLAWAGLGNTYFWADPALGRGGVLLTQVLPFGDPVVLDLLGALERGAYAGG